MRKFKKEKVWDERRAAYKNIIESLEELVYWAEQVRAEHYCEPTIGNAADFDNALRNISKYASTGGLTFSSEFHELVIEIDSQISRKKFSIDEESKGDIDKERERSEWICILAKEIRQIAENGLSKLIKSATKELPQLRT